MVVNQSEAPQTESKSANEGPDAIDSGAILRLLEKQDVKSKNQHDLNEVVHQVLIIGLYSSVALMLTGIVIDLVRHRALPTQVLPIREAIMMTLQLRASGFFSLGLIILILTPMLRVIGSIVVFLWERDWRYAGITFLVLVVMLISIAIGEG